ncbi:MAG TPA: SMI1/KNR4 family protein [Cytophagales bacterium]|nr:SMI1/KNR4 family protein [Cytophagales bacterium]
MTLSDLHKILAEIPFKDISIGYSEFEFAEKETFDDFQVGYRINEEGINLSSEEKGGWQNSWYTIGIDDLGDPIFIDLNDGIIYTSQEEEEGWEPIAIASNFDKFKQIVFKLNEMSQGRETPKKFEKSPIPAKAKNEFYSLLNEEHEDIDIEYWSGIIED